MLKQRRYVINYILNNQPEAIDIQTDAENLTDEDAENFIYEVLDVDQPANITDIRIFQRAVDITGDLDVNGNALNPEEGDPLNATNRHEEE
ncbi:MAG: hypothetical protein EOO52_08665 [Gammaproteobacteria bacterium]|nr:MAG: hypothetical protein EOO52_08665 [Gammaproteobacteria bacterium]